MKKEETEFLLNFNSKEKDNRPGSRPRDFRDYRDNKSKDSRDKN